MEDVVVCLTEEESETYRKIAEKVWEEGYESGWDDGWDDARILDKPITKNPYRKDEK